MVNENSNYIRRFGNLTGAFVNFKTVFSSSIYYYIVYVGWFLLLLVVGLE